MILYKVLAVYSLIFNIAFTIYSAKLQSRKEQFILVSAFIIPHAVLALGVLLNG